jgi:hypothetical protein
MGIDPAKKLPISITPESKISPRAVSILMNKELVPLQSCSNVHGVPLRCRNRNYDFTIAESNQQHQQVLARVDELSETSERQIENEPFEISRRICRKMNEK